MQLTLNVEISADGAVSDQKLEEAKMALQELGLDDNVAQKNKAILWRWSCYCQLDQLMTRTKKWQFVA